MSAASRGPAPRAVVCAILSTAVFLAGASAVPGASPTSDEAVPGGPLRRFALVMGANDGGPDLERLRYAASDARSFAAVMTELGGVADRDLILLIDPGIAAFRGAASRLVANAASATASGARCELVLYYSGHSDDEGLLLGKERLGYPELRAEIEKVPAAVRVAILDSCSSGSLTRAKGGSSRPAFLYDESSIQEGHAYITSSSADEAAQESDRIGGSFFTHYLISALRGAADARGEGKVTLNEAYAYSFRETLASTENTRYGPQHPGYEISLTGSGDLVVTDLRSSKAGLILSEELAGSMYVRDAKGNLAVELDKAAGDRMELGLPPGRYSVALIEGNERSQADVAVTVGAKAALRAADFRGVAVEPTDARGIAIRPSQAPAAIIAGPREEIDTSLVGFPISLGMTVWPDFSHGIYFSQQDKVISFNILWGGARDVRSLQFSLLLNADSGDLGGFQFAGLANLVRGNARGVQIAGLAMMTSGDMAGAQIAGLGNVVSGDSGGVQLSGFANLTMGKARFAQIAGFGNVASGGFSGLQIANGVNLAGDDGRGAQVGTVNVASRIAGAQVGVVNVASSVAGTQVGVVNISDRIDGVPFGLVNIEREGVRSFQFWADDVSSVRIGYALGTRFVYDIASIGFGFGTQPQSPSASLGLGGRMIIGPFFGNLDCSWQELFGDDGALDFARPQARLEARALAGFPAKGPGLIVGCGLEAYMPGLSRENDGSSVVAFHVVPSLLFGAKLGQ